MLGKGWRGVSFLSRTPWERHVPETPPIRLPFAALFVPISQSFRLFQAFALPLVSLDPVGPGKGIQGRFLKFVIHGGR